MGRLLLLPLLVACADPAPTRVVPDPGPPPHEAPPTATLWRGDQPVARVLAATPDGRARIDLQRRLYLDGHEVADHALPELSMGPRGLAFTRSEAPPASDVWLAEGAKLRRVSQDGRSDRPVQLRDGTLLWISAEGGHAHWVREGRRLTGPEVPVPARAMRTRVERDRVVYDAGDAWWALDPVTGEATRRP